MFHFRRRLAAAAVAAGLTLTGSVVGHAEDLDCSTAPTERMYQVCEKLNNMTREGNARHAESTAELNLLRDKTKNEITLRIGTAPGCQSSDAKTEICTWTWMIRAESYRDVQRVTVTCVLPRDATPREARSCRAVADR